MYWLFTSKSILLKLSIVPLETDNDAQWKVFSVRMSINTAAAGQRHWKATAPSDDPLLSAAVPEWLSALIYGFRLIFITLLNNYDDSLITQKWMDLYINLWRQLIDPVTHEITIKQA